MKRKNILFIARWYPDKYDPMLGLFVQAHAKAASIFHNITVLYVTSDINLPKGKIEVDIRMHGEIREVRIYFGKHKNSFINFYKYVHYFLKGVRIAEKESGTFDLSHVHILSRCALPALYLKIRSGTPYLITEHWSRYLPVNLMKGAYTGLFRKLFTGMAVRSAECITTVTQNLATAMQDLGLRNTYHIIPNVADTKLFHPSSNSNEELTKKLVHVSCFDEPAKNIKGIINAVKKLSETRSDFVLHIIGTGEDYDDVEAYGKATGLAGSRIIFKGLMTGEPLASEMREAKALVMFSNYENLPCTIVESICSGVPVISTKVGGISEHVDERSGILIEPRQEAALIDAINAVLDEHKKFDKQTISDYGSKHFSMQAIGQQFNQLYTKILSS